MFHKKNVTKNPDNLGFISQWSDYLLAVSAKVETAEAPRLCDRHMKSTGAGGNSWLYLFSFAFALAAKYLGRPEMVPGYRFKCLLVKVQREGKNPC